MSDPAADQTGRTGQRGTLLRRFLPVAVIVLGFGAAYFAGALNYVSLPFLGKQHETLQSLVNGHPFVSAALFVMVYVAVVALSLPAATVLTVFGGFLFGWLAAGTLVVFAATTGATILFLAARSSFGGFLHHRLGQWGETFAEGFEKDAFNYLLVLRLAPIVPFFVVNVAPAVFNVRTRDFVFATFLGIMPGTFAYTWLGAGLDSVFKAAQASGSEPSLSDLVTPQITIAFLALAAVASIPLLIRKLRKNH